MILHVGVLACNYIEEAGNAYENEKCWVVDEAKAAATNLQTEGQTVQASEMGRHTRSQWERDGPEFSRRPKARYKVPSLPWSRAPGNYAIYFILLYFLSVLFPLYQKKKKIKENSKIRYWYHTSVFGTTMVLQCSSYPQQILTSSGS